MYEFIPKDGFHDFWHVISPPLGWKDYLIVLEPLVLLAIGMEALKLDAKILRPPRTELVCSLAPWHS